MSFKPSASDTISLSWEDEELFPDEDDTAQSNSTPAGPPHTAAGAASAQPAPSRCGTAVWKDSSREAVANCRETADGERGHARGPAIVPETPRSSIWTERVLAHLKRSKQLILNKQMQHRQLWWVRGLGRKQASMPGLPDSTSLHGNPNRRLSPSQSCRTQECRPASMKRRLSAQPPPSMAKRRVVTGGCEATGQSLQSTPANTPPGLKQVLHAPSAVALKQRKAQAGGSPSGAAAVSRSPGVLCKRPVSTTQKPQLAWVTPEKLAARAARFGISLES
eukprot:jgi/Tetstr1/429872/TSEL_019737.t1